MTRTARTAAARPADRVGAGDWAALAAELDEHGCALTGPLLSPDECHEISALYEDTDRFRTSVDMARHRFGSGQYRYFTHELPDVVRELRAAFYPRLLPIARDWAGRLGQPAPGAATSFRPALAALGSRIDRFRPASARHEDGPTPCAGRVTCAATPRPAARRSAPGRRGRG